MTRVLMMLACLVGISPAFGAGTLVKVPTRPGVETTLFWEPVEGARLTVLLFPGGGGGFGKVENGRPTSNNFLVRTVPEFVANGFNVAVFGRPGDSSELGYADRISADHMTDVRAVIAYLRKQTGVPLWVVGTSRGTVSATAIAVSGQELGLAGLVASSSVTNIKKDGALPRQDLAAIRIPVLLFHHSKDACKVCDPRELPDILRSLTQAPVKKLIMVNGGANPTGDECAAMHWHGYIGMEKEAVDTIAAWMKKPVP